MYGTGAPPPPHAPYYYREGPLHRPGTAPMYPGTYGHPPLMEEKTILRKKFSWKHYPEVRRTLIDICEVLFMCVCVCMFVVR
jgi:hypothetical protein